MEKNTIGSFISVLRKANGMTQQQLADRLNVSNKSVSRWERDESLPDLTLIPVIAEIFEITSDELLKGERNTNKAETEKSTQKTDRQIKRILYSRLTRFKILSYISFAITFIGIIVMLVCGYGFYKVILGFGLGVAFFIISLLSEIIFSTYAFAAINSEEFEGNNLYSCRRTILKYMEAVIYLNVIAIAVCFPFILIRNHTYVDSVISFRTWLLLVPFCILIAMIINYILSIVLSKFIAKNQTFYLGEYETAKLAQLTRFKVIHFIITGTIMITTLLLQIAINDIPYTQLCNHGQSFSTFEEFKEFIETPLSVTDEDTINLSNIFYDVATDANGSSINELKYMIDDQGKVQKYYYRNHSIVLISHAYDLLNGWGKPITVYTKQEVNKGDKVKNNLNIIFAVIYLIEVILGCIIYFRKHNN